MSERRIQELEAMGPPAAEVARMLRLTKRRTGMSKTERLARVKRIQAHIAAYPGKSYCYPEDDR